MTSATKITIVTLFAISLAISPKNGANAFWLTDGSLFQQPVAEQLVQTQFIENQLPVQKTLSTLSSSSIEQTTSTANKQLDNKKDVELSSSSKDSSASSSRRPGPAPWIPLTDTPTFNNKNELTQPDATGSSACQCDSGWLANQTSAMLNKWLGSSHFANRIRSLVLSPTFVSATGRLNNSSSTASHTGANSSRSSVAWNKAASAAGRRHERHSQAAAATKLPGPAHQQRSATVVATTTQQRNNQWQQQHQHSRNLQQPVPQESQAIQSNTRVVAQGERGPKGDQGERGPSGLISVKDRDALFDLAAAASGSPRLVFVESEQLLVLETAGPSWRPIALSAPLHDFRKTIAKYSVNSLEGQRLLVQAVAASSSSGSSDSLAANAQVRPAAAAADPASSKSKIFLLNSSGQLSEQPLAPQLSSVDSGKRKGGDETVPGGGRVLAIDGEDDADDDDEEDDEEEDDEEDDLKMEDDEDVEPDEGEDDDDDDEEANSIGERVPSSKGAQARASLAVHSSSALMTNKIPIRQSDTTEEQKKQSKKRARSQVSSRSAMSVPVGDDDASSTGDFSFDSTNSILRRANSAAPIDEAEETTTTTDVMKLRLVALNEPFSGNQHGLRGANFECKRNAARAGVKGAFRAFLATNYQNLNEIVRYNSHVQKYPIVNLHGDTVASSWHDLFKSPARSINPLSRIQSFDGRHVASDPNWPNKLIWLGTGSKFGHRESSSYNCDGWHSDSLNKVGYATPLHSPKNHHHVRNHHIGGRRYESSAEKHEKQRRSARGTDDRLTTPGHNSSAGSSLVFDLIEKYPCRMPLIVLCIETVAQAD